MEAVLAGLFAIGGTLLGSLVTYLFQQRATQRAEQFTISARLREERMTVYSGFAGTVLEFRSAQYTRALQGFEGKEDTTYEEAKATSYRLRAASWHSLYRVRLLADDSEITRLAENAMILVADMHDAEGRSALTRRGDDVREAVEEFITAASAEVTRAKPVPK
ncbi:hypothetical protein ACFXJ8_28785 [Nonomuraea sp. NPDC059194]|uniref:hypothetical protein n=1 Tax=Nonomuraea sp. NPDC059194 TaxID=3346764 RepID=UPI0036A4AA63